MKFNRLLIFFTGKINWKEILLDSTLSQLKCAEKNYKGEYFYLPQFAFFFISNA